MKNSKLFITGLLVMGTTTFNSCKEDNSVTETEVTQAVEKTYYCEKVAFCHGYIQSFVTLSDDKPTAIGVRLSGNILEGLPSDPHNNIPELRLKVPEEGKDIGIDHIDFGWNPLGHDPQPIYTLPHFDLHFYMVSPEAQAAVRPGPDPITVPQAFIPADYVTGGIAVPNMGVHYGDSQAPELKGSVFTTTYIYGFYRGKMTFWEPMFTRSFLLTKPQFTAPVKQPASFQKSGYYPTSYRISYDEQAKEYTIVAEGLKYHEGLKTISFKGLFQTISEQLSTASPNQKITGQGELTTLGKVSFEALSTLVLTPPPPFKLSGTSFMTLANGDRINSTFTGTAVPQPDGKFFITVYHNVNGGTGQYSKASGYYIGTTLADRTNPAGTLTTEGEISY